MIKWSSLLSDDDLKYNFNLDIHFYICFMTLYNTLMVYFPQSLLQEGMYLSEWFSCLE